MEMRRKARAIAHRLWTRAITYCEAEDKIAEMRQRVHLAYQAAENAQLQSEQKIAKVRQQSQVDVESANKDAAEAEMVFKEKQNDLKLLKARIDTEAIPVVTDMIAKAREESSDALRQVKKKKSIATLYIEKIRKRIAFYENTSFDLTFEDMQALRKTLEYEFYNTERKLDAITNVVGNWDIPRKLRNRIEDDRSFLQSLNAEVSWIVQP